MAAFRQLLDISADFTIPYRPQSNGIVERKNLNVLTHLRALLTTNLDVTSNWHSLLPIVQRICNATDVSSIGCAPAQIIFGNLIHLHRGLENDFSVLPPSTPGATDYIATLLRGQQELISASQRHLASVKDKSVAASPSQPSRTFSPNSYVLVAYPTDFRPKLANQLRGPFTVVSQASSLYLLRSFVDPSKTLSIHISRLRPYIYNPTYSDSPLTVAATDIDEAAIDYITTHEGNPARTDSLTFRVNWLGQADDEATWQSYESIKLTQALDNYIIDYLPTCPQLFHLVPPKDRTLIKLDAIGTHIWYIFNYGDHELRVPIKTIRTLPDVQAIFRAARSLPTTLPTPPPT